LVAVAVVVVVVVQRGAARRGCLPLLLSPDMLQ